MPGPERYDTIILGAGAAGMMCAIHAASRGARVAVLDHAKTPGEKIRISGGGRCNFTNMYTGPENFLSGNPHFAKSALSRYTQYDFIELVGNHSIAWHEKTLGQLFCDESATQIVAMLRDEMSRAGVRLRLQTSVHTVKRSPDGFRLATHDATFSCRNLVIATGGKSIPKMGASDFGYRIAEQFGLGIRETRAALVPLTFGEEQMKSLRALAGVAVDARVTSNGTSFDEAVLFTHRGLSGPAILQISSFWREKAALNIDLAPGAGLFETLRNRRAHDGRRFVATVLAEYIPKRLAQHISGLASSDMNLGDISDEKLSGLAKIIHEHELRPSGTEGYRTAEVTLGGVDTGDLSSATMEARNVSGLYFVGEVVDVTGWLGGYNFQWAWSSGWAAGTAIAEQRT